MQRGSRLENMPSQTVREIAQAFKKQQREKILKVKRPFKLKSFIVVGVFKAQSGQVQQGKDTTWLREHGSYFLPSTSPKNILKAPRQLPTFSSSDTRSSKSAILAYLNPTQPHLSPPRKACWERWGSSGVSAVGVESRCSLEDALKIYGAILSRGTHIL